MSSKIQPLGDRLVIRELEATEEKIGSIYIPDNAKEKPQHGEVIALGDDENMLARLAVGDKIIYAKYSGTEVRSGVETLIIIQFAEVLAKLLED